MLARQGGHQVAQNSTTYTFPGSNLATLSPLTQSLMSIAGAASPTCSGLTAGFSAAAGAGAGLGFSGVFWPMAADPSARAAAAAKTDVCFMEVSLGWRDQWIAEPHAGIMSFNNLYLSSCI